MDALTTAAVAAQAASNQEQAIMHAAAWSLGALCSISRAYSDDNYRDYSALVGLACVAGFSAVAVTAISRWLLGVGYDFDGANVCLPIAVGLFGKKTDRLLREIYDALGNRIIAILAMISKKQD